MKIMKFILCYCAQWCRRFLSSILLAPSSVEIFNFWSRLAKRLKISQNDVLMSTLFCEIFNFSTQNLSIESNFFKWDGKVTKIWHNFSIELRKICIIGTGLLKNSTHFMFVAKSNVVPRCICIEIEIENIHELFWLFILKTNKPQNRIQQSNFIRHHSIYFMLQIKYIKEKNPMYHH